MRICLHRVRTSIQKPQSSGEISESEGGKGGLTDIFSTLTLSPWYFSSPRLMSLPPPGPQIYKEQEPFLSCPLSSDTISYLSWYTWQLSSLQVSLALDTQHLFIINHYTPASGFWIRSQNPAQLYLGLLTPTVQGKHINENLPILDTNSKNAGKDRVQEHVHIEIFWYRRRVGSGECRLVSWLWNRVQRNSRVIRQPQWISTLMTLNRCRGLFLRKHFWINALTDAEDWV